MIGHIPDLCKSTNKARFTCNGAKVVYNASLIWGTIGPQRMFQAGQVYSSLMYFFAIGVSALSTSPYHSQNYLLANPYPARRDGRCVLALQAIPQELAPIRQ